MILIGSMNLTRTRERGDFYCPTCGTIQGYRLRARRQFLTLYFIPTVPISAAEIFICCDQCHSNWDETVLHVDQREHQAIQEEQFRDEAIRSAILMTLEDDVITELEITSLLYLSKMLFDRPMDREELGRLCSIAREMKIETEDYVLTISKRWTVQQRLLALQGMFLAATAGEENLSSRKLKTLENMRDRLQLTDQEFQAAIEDAMDYVVV